MGVDDGRVIRVGVPVEIDLARPHVIKEGRLLTNLLAVERFACFLDQDRQDFDESIAPPILENKFKVTISG